MADPFAVALAALFRAPGSVAVVYSLPGGGLTLSIRVIRTNGREIQQNVIFDTEAVQIQRSDVANPVQGALLTFDDGSRYRIQSPPELDRERLTWTCPLEPA